MIAINLDHRWGVRLSATVTLDLPATNVWHHARQFESFVTSDAFHGRVCIEGGTPRAGARLTINHRYLGLGPNRHGRILRWAEGIGYSFSDLSSRGVRLGFPHIYSYDIAPAGPERCVLTLHVRGRWTATWLPRWSVRLWFAWVMLLSSLRLRNHILFAELKRRRHAVA